MDGKPKRLKFVLQAVVIVVGFLIALFCFSLLHIWDCGVCRNPHPGAFTACPYCNGTGKQNLIQRVRAGVGLRGGGFLQDR